jgi:hypothetical protein
MACDDARAMGMEREEALDVDELDVPWEVDDLT